MPLELAASAMDKATRCAAIVKGSLPESVAPHCTSYFARSQPPTHLAVVSWLAPLAWAYITMTWRQLISCSGARFP